jgi:hypothetical protein
MANWLLVAVRRFGQRALNYYRLEAGRFENFVSYGLKSFAHEERREHPAIRTFDFKQT